jgi:Zn-dependent metalloprotease
MNGILPPYIVERLAESTDRDVRRAARRNLASSAAARAVRRVLATLPRMAAIPSPAGKKHRLVYDAEREERLPGRLVRSEGEKGPRDLAVREAYDHSGATYDFFFKFFGRNSLDDRGMSLISSVHVGRSYANAFWDGEQMAYGDGDGRTFVRFTKAVDVVAHELTHGVVAHTSNLDYEDESGALNEHFADVFGTLVKQWTKNQTVTQADWLIGDAILIRTPTRRAIRSLSAPGTAFREDPDLGTDPQPDHLSKKYTGPDDNGGVHLNSGIPNKAFFLAARAMGGRAWEKAGPIWYHALRALAPRSDFREAARATADQAGRLFGRAVAQTVRDAWKTVGVNGAPPSS